eukprot:COSAG03_NODE_4691_length_1465_cov_0.983895_2_plen_76_part_00
MLVCASAHELCTHQLHACPRDDDRPAATTDAVNRPLDRSFAACLRTRGLTFLPRGLDEWGFRVQNQRLGFRTRDH